MGNRFGIQVTEDGWPPPVTIVLADDHDVMRSGLRVLLDEERDLKVLAEAADVESALRAVDEWRPDVLVLDLNMPGDPSLAAIAAVTELSPATAVVVLTMQDGAESAREALRHGARGYVVKDSASAELVNAIHTAADGGTYLNPSLGANPDDG